MLNPVTENERIDQLEAARRRAELIAQINIALSLAEDEHGLLAAMWPLFRQYGAGMALVSEAEADTDGGVAAIEFVAIQTSDGQALPLEFLPKRRFTPEENAILRIARADLDQPLFIENIALDERIAPLEREMARDMGVSASLAFWLRAGGSVRGMIRVNWPQPISFDPDLPEIMAAIQPVAAAPSRACTARWLKPPARPSSSPISTR